MQALTVIERNVSGTFHHIPSIQLPSANKATFFPHKVRYEKGALLQTNQARLMQSKKTGNYILFGSCGKHSKQAGRKEPWIGSNQVYLTSPSR